MHLFRRPQRTDTPPSEWAPLPDVHEGDTVADDQLGTTYRVTYRNGRLPRAVITVWSFADRDGAETGFGVRRMVEWLLGHNPDDPVGTETWSAMFVDDDIVSGPFAWFEDADSDAAGYAQGLAEGRAMMPLHDTPTGAPALEWDGEPFEVPED